MNAGGSCDYCWCLSFFGFLRPNLSPWGYVNRFFLVALCCLIVRRMNLEVATKRLLHQLVKIPGSFSAMFVHGSVPLQLFRVVWIFLRFLGVICYDRWFLSEGLKNYFRDWCLMNSQPTFFIFNLFKLNELWPYYQKHVNQMILNHTIL